MIDYFSVMRLIAILRRALVVGAVGAVLYRIFFGNTASSGEVAGAFQESLRFNPKLYLILHDYPGSCSEKG